jgi:hypothetical protein
MSLHRCRRVEAGGFDDVAKRMASKVGLTAMFYERSTTCVKVEFPASPTTPP